MEEGFADGSSDGLIAATAVAGVVAGGVMTSLIYFFIKGRLWNHLGVNPATTSTQPLPSTTQGGKRQTRRSRPHRGTRRV